MKKWTATLFVMGSLLIASTQVYAAGSATNTILPVAETGGASDSVNPGGPIQDKQMLYTPLLNANPVTYSDLRGYPTQAVQRLTAAGLLPVAADGVFQQDVPVSRQDFKSWLQTIAGVSLSDDDNPLDPVVKRVQVAQWIADALPGLNTGVAGVNNEMKVYPYDDTANLNDEQRQALLYLYDTGLMVGDGQRHFNPSQAMTRGQAAVLLDRVLQKTLAFGKPYSYNVVAGTLPDAVSNRLNQLHDQQGLFTVVDHGTRYVILAGGTVPTSGYTVTIDSAVETAAGIFVQASLHDPDPSSIQSQIVSYPNLIFSTTDLSKPIYLIGQ